MQCPFCAEDILDQALVCRHCHRDLTVLRPVIDRFAALTRRIDELEAKLGERLDAAETALADLKTAPPEIVADSPRAEVAPADAPGDPSPSPTPTRPPGPAWVGLLAGGLLAPVLALVAAHWLVVMELDLKVWVIRVASLVLPLPFGILAFARSGHRLGLAALPAPLVAVAAVLGMSAVTGWMDSQPILPQDGRDWREFIEYALSIGLSFATGALLAHHFRPARDDPATAGAARRIAVQLAGLTAPENETRAQMEKRIGSLAGFVGAMVPAVTAVISVITGVRKLWE